MYSVYSMQGVFIRRLELLLKILTISVKALLSISKSDYGADVRQSKIQGLECFFWEIVVLFSRSQFISFRSSVLIPYEFTMMDIGQVVKAILLAAYILYK